MKKLFASLSLMAFCLFSIAQSAQPETPAPGQGHYRGGHPNKAVQQYVKEHIMPVLLQKRQLLEQELTTAEKSDLVTYRTQLKQLAAERKEQLQQKPAGVSMHEFMQSDEQKALAKQDHQQMKQIMQNVEAIANNHLATLDNIHAQLEPSRKQWSDDITNLRATARAQKASSQSALVSVDNAGTKDASATNTGPQNWQGHKGGMMEPGMGHMFEGQKGYAHFLLLSANATPTTSDDLTGDLESLITDQPSTSTGSTALASFQLLPNPASNELVTGNGQLPGSNQFKLLDMQGRVALTLQNVQPAQHIDVSQLPSGTYLAQLISTGGQPQESKIVISH